jgi:glutamine phosphoribosylpyrophosphate amidotransferase
MCGIGALSRATPSSLADGALSLRLMAMGLEERGRDATGFAFTTRDVPHPHYWKDDMPASMCVWGAPLPNLIRTAIVHTRFGTKGKASNPCNNHPIILPGISLVHNGIVTNDDEIFGMLNCKRVAEVDTEAVAALLAYGPETFGTDDPAELLELVEGDAALAWINSADSSVLHLARLLDRPLVLAWTRKGDLLAASTHTALRFAAMDATIVDTRAVAEGTYLQVRAGQIIDERPILLPERKYKSSYTPGATVTTYTATGKTTVSLPAKSREQETREALGKSLNQLRRERRDEKRRKSERGTGGELIAIGAGSPTRTFKSELEASADDWQAQERADLVAKWDRLMEVD